MNLYLISQDENDDYDTYDGMVVAAENEAIARNITPTKSGFETNSWCSSPDKVEVKLIGRAVKGTVSGIILSSFNAG